MPIYDIRTRRPMFNVELIQQAELRERFENAEIERRAADAAARDAERGQRTGIARAELFGQPLHLGARGIQIRRGRRGLPARPPCSWPVRSSPRTPWD